MNNKLPSFHSYFTHNVVNIPKINKLATGRRRMDEMYTIDTLRAKLWNNLFKLCLKSVFDATVINTEQKGDFLFLFEIFLGNKTR